jgi:Trichohyalin-plectin-homology domain
MVEEKERIAAEKEAETARLRAAQEKAADRQSELDELRARRHAEAAEREWRVRETAKAARDKARRLRLATAATLF